MATNLNPLSPDTLLKIVAQVKEYYVEPPPHHRGRPRTFSGRAFLLLAVVGVVLRTFKPQELATLLTKDASLRQALGFSGGPLHGGSTPRGPKSKPKSKPWASRF